MTSLEDLYVNMSYAFLRWQQAGPESCTNSLHTHFTKSYSKTGELVYSDVPSDKLECPRETRWREYVKCRDAYEEAIIPMMEAIELEIARRRVEAAQTVH